MCDTVSQQDDARRIQTMFLKVNYQSRRDTWYN